MVQAHNYHKDVDSVDEFPAGLRVLVVDDDPICLMILERMLHQCSYQVTTCGRATKALELLREDKDKFDLVISDVYMPDMDGFKLLELVGLEMDLPVIMMSADGETSAVMKGITHGACDYLLKPVRLEELRNIWQHVLRKKRTGAKDVEHSTSHEEGERRKFGGGEDVEYTSSATDTTDGNCKLMKRRKEIKEDDEDTEQENDDPSTLKKPRVVWSVELHQQFVSAVHQLGIDKAVPKRILELMSVHGLTRENVASHLQKYRLYLRRLSGVTSQQNGMNVMFGGSETAFGHVSSLDSIGNLRTLAATGQLSPQTVAGVHASRIGREVSHNCMGLPSSLDPSMTRPHMNGGLFGTQSCSVQSLPGGVDVDPILQLHNLSAMGRPHQLDDVPGLRSLQHQLVGTSAGNCNTLGLHPVGGPSVNLAGRPSSEGLLMQLFQQRAQQQGGGGLSVHLPQPSAVLGTPCLLSTGINLGQAGSLADMGRELGSSLGAAVASIPSSLGSLVQPPDVGVQTSNLVGSMGGSFNGSATVLSPTIGGAPGPSKMNDMPRPQHSMKTSLNPLGQASHMHGQVLSQSSRPTWLGSQGGMVFAEQGQSIESGLSPWFPSQNQAHVGRFAENLQQLGQPDYTGQGMNFPVSLGLDIKPLLDGSQSQSGQPATYSEQKLLKDERASDNIIITKDGGLVPHDRSEDLLTFFFKQSHDGISFPDSDGYRVDNFYVK